MCKEIPCIAFTSFPLAAKGWGELRMETGDQGSLAACPMVNR